MPNLLLGARTPPAPPRDTWDAPWPGTLRGGILGRFAEPDGTWDRSAFTGRRLTTPLNASAGILGSADDLPLSPSTPIEGQMAEDAPTPLSLPVPSRPDLLALLARAQFESGGESMPTAGKKVDQAECDDMHRRDLFHCKMVGLPSCYAQAYLRYTNCLNGRQIPTAKLLNLRRRSKDGRVTRAAVQCDLPQLTVGLMLQSSAAAPRDRPRGRTIVTRLARHGN